jgi:hypothetical protein
LKNYSITDLNKTNYNTDTITITNARFKDRDLWLTIKGVTIAPLEQYQLTLKNITDTNGNKLDPNPTILTLVQR